MRLLPKWALLDPPSAIYDLESVTPLQQTARVYGAMNDMIREYNTFADQINKEISEFVGSSEAEISNFKESVEKRIQCKFNNLDAMFAKIRLDIKSLEVDLTNLVKDQFNDAIVSGKIEIIDADLLAGKKIVMLGDSNAKGVGWAGSDGVFSVLQDLIPNATFSNYAKGGAGFLAGETVLQQTEKIVTAPDIIFVWAGGNDISGYLDGNIPIGAHYPESFDPGSFDGTLYGAVNNTLYTLRSRFPSAQICGVIRTIKQDGTQETQQGVYGQIVKIYQKYQCSVINLNDFSNITEIDSQDYYWSDAIHYSERAYREKIAPVFYAALMNNLNINTSMFVDTVFTSSNATLVNAENIDLCFPYGAENVGTKILKNVKQENYSILTGAKVNDGAIAMFRLPTASSKITYHYGTKDSLKTSFVNTTTAHAAGANIASLGNGRHIFMGGVAEKCTGLPASYVEGGFYVDITEVQTTGFKYALYVHCEGYMHLGVKYAADAAFTWKKIVLE